MSGLRPGDRVGSGEVWAPGPAAGTVWVAVPDPDVAGLLLGDGSPVAVSVAEQRARIARADRVTELGAVVAADPEAARGLFGASTGGVVHVPGCPARVGGEVLQRAAVARCALAGDLDGLREARHVRGRFRVLRWCPDCLGEQP